MPLKKGHSREIVSQNIREMVASGHKPKQAIAAALANARQSKKMAEGGMVDDDAMGSIDSAHDAGEAGEAVYPEGMDDQGLSSNVEEQQALAQALQKSGHAANDNTHDFEPDDSVAGAPMAEGGLVVDHANNMVGNKPELDFIDDGSEEPMSAAPMKPAAGKAAPAPGMTAGLSEDAKRALARKKAARRYGQNDPK